MAQISYKITGLDRLISTIVRAGVEMPIQFRRAMLQATEEVKAEARSNAPVRTGAMRQSITSMVDPNPLAGRVSVLQPYAKYVEFGTRPHVIVPKSANALVFKAGGVLVFTKRVNHPGTRANPFLQRALETKRNKIQEYFQRAAISVLNEIKGA